MSEPGKKLTAVIVDDEELARQVVREMLKSHAEIEIVGECANGFESVKTVGELNPDLMFLDIQMPKLDGFEVLELLEGNVAVVFVTAHDEHALRAFEVHAVDYLLKPFSTDRFEAALERAKLRVGNAVPAARELASAARQPGEYASRIVVKDGTRVQIIPAAKLDFVEAQDDYVALASQGKKHLKQQTIASIEAMLDPRKLSSDPSFVSGQPGTGREGGAIRQRYTRCRASRRDATPGEPIRIRPPQAAVGGQNRLTASAC
jgi:two-component system LytT family response regulator